MRRSMVMIVDRTTTRPVGFADLLVSTGAAVTMHAALDLGPTD